MSYHCMTGVSAAATEKTHTLTLPAGKYQLLLHSLTVSTGAADIASDCTVLVTSGTGETWSVEMRTAKVFGGHFDFGSCPIVSRGGDMTIVTDSGGTDVVVTVSATYEVV